MKNSRNASGRHLGTMGESLEAGRRAQQATCTPTRARPVTSGQSDRGGRTRHRIRPPRSHRGSPQGASPITPTAAAASSSAVNFRRAHPPTPSLFFLGGGGGHRVLGTGQWAQQIHHAPLRPSSQRVPPRWGKAPQPSPFPERPPHGAALYEESFSVPSCDAVRQAHRWHRLGECSLK